MSGETFGAVVVMAFIGLLVLAGIVIAVPYIVAYVLPAIVLGLCVGWGWVKGSHAKEKRVRHYERLIWMIPISAIALKSLLLVIEPKSTLDTKNHHHRRPTVIEPTDPLKEGFCTFYLKWYGMLFRVKEAETSFDFDQFSKVLWIGLGVIAPLFGIWFSRRDLELLADEVNRARSQAQAEWQKREHVHQEDVHALTHQLKEAGKILESQNARIEALENREKFLSRPGALTSEFQRPDLSGL